MSVPHTASSMARCLVQEDRKESQEETNPGGAGSTLGNHGKGISCLFESRDLVTQIAQSVRVDHSQENVWIIVVVCNLKMRYHHINIGGLE